MATADLALAGGKGGFPFIRPLGVVLPPLARPILPFWSCCLVPWDSGLLIVVWPPATPPPLPLPEDLVDETDDESEAMEESSGDEPS